jgi:hypothetical protein
MAGYRKLKEGIKIDWWERCQNISNPDNYVQLIRKRINEYDESLKEGKNLRSREIKIIKKEIRNQNRYF